MDTPRLLRHAAIGAAGGLAGALTMNLFAAAVNRATHGHEATDAAPGRSRIGRGMQPPQADGAAEDDGAVRVGTAAFEAVTGTRPGPRTRLRLGTLAHYAFGGSAGMVYGVLVDRAPGLRAGGGALFGSLVWAIADEGMTPALGLSRGPRQLSGGLHAYSLTGHWVYGATVELVRRLLTRPSHA